MRENRGGGQKGRAEAASGGRALRRRWARDSEQNNGREKRRENPAEAVAARAGAAVPQRPSGEGALAHLCYSSFINLQLLEVFLPERLVLDLLSVSRMRTSIFVCKKKKKNPSQIGYSQHLEFVLKYMKVFKYIY